MAQGIRSFPVLVFPGQGCYVAQFLDYDIVTQAPTLGQLKEAIGSLIAAHIDFARKRGREPFEGLEPAPAEHWKTYEAMGESKAVIEDIVLVEADEEAGCPRLAALMRVP
jgi:hypothetical protein